ncbi:hypothetical protein RJ641_006850 [Dillenia turbinata]|uniref:Uncharacterized protein n=1 Tax=Dillenia turbinata TaxID=194707 RepID=A0AAN8Z6G5_9MAGN
MEEEEEHAKKTEALKKAYADIILNTTKEAALKIMISERKALRIQYKLKTTKDEAIRILVRMKQMLDAKDAEAMDKTLNQQRKVDELEAQLSEAEEIISDLRSELRLAQDKLHNMKTKGMQPVVIAVPTEDVHCQCMSNGGTRNDSEPAMTSSPAPVSVPVVASPRNTGVLNRISENCCHATSETKLPGDSHVQDYQPKNQKLSSIYMTSKEPELCINGCTQRIRAFEMNSRVKRLSLRGVMGGKLPPSGDNKPPPADIEGTVKTDEIDNSDEEERGELDTDDLEAKPVKPVKRLQRRKIRYGRKRATSRKSTQLKKCPQPTSVAPHHKTGQNAVEDTSMSGDEAPSIPASRVDIVQTAKQSAEFDGTGLPEGNLFKVDGTLCDTSKLNFISAIDSSGRTHPDQLSKPSETSPFLCHCQSSSNSSDSVVTSDNFGWMIPEKLTKFLPLSRFGPGLTSIKSKINPQSGPSNLVVSVTENKSVGVQNAENKKTGFIDVNALVKSQDDPPQSSGVPSKCNLHLVDVPSTVSNSKDLEASKRNNENSSKVDEDRPLKYTFQRKRKKDSMSSPVDRTLEENYSRRMAAEKRSNASESKKLNLINESSRDTRRVAQVARQQINQCPKALRNCCLQINS